MVSKKLFLMSMVVILSGCGGSGGGSPAIPTPGLPDTPVSTTLTGVFLDSPVINITYSTESLSGVTNALGEFDYLAGETVTFSIGDLSFPSAGAAALVTPLDLVGTQDLSNPEVLNIVRLLQALDEDGDPDNGITISDTAKSIATQLDFGLSQSGFAASVLNFIFNAGQDSTVTPVDIENTLLNIDGALDHFREQLADRGVAFGAIAEQDDNIINNYLTENNLQAEYYNSGLYYQIIDEGSDGHPAISSVVDVKYTGTFLDGTVFDQTTGDNSIQFQLGSLISGWQIGIPLLQKGGRAVLYLPSALAYGAQGTAGIPPNSVLIFEIELVDFD
jgi:hypothetical protein